ncbi:MAG: class I SAM-dependent methyltransferase [Fulvivirga sp.]|uniref:class I SAM-dependent methyltransferase n=1 Tax=Fulvivirga sp. TaxID=1931237 RepID=UPI0032EE6A91
MNNFNSIAFIYDKLAHIVFGKAIIESQQVHLGHIKNGKSILICGGGTGQILRKLDALNVSLKVDFVEKSRGMIERACRHAPFKNLQVNFINQDIFDVDLGEYDVIVTPFFLDIFSRSNLVKLIATLSASVKPKGCWINTDFKISNVWWKKVMILFMYLFFRLTANLEGKKLHDFELLIIKSGLSKVESTTFFKAMIDSSIYKKL